MSFRLAGQLVAGFALSVAVHAAELDCAALIDTAEELRQMREHDAAGGVERTSALLEELGQAGRQSCPAGVAQVLRARATNLTVLGELDEALADVERGLAVIEDSGINAPVHVAALHLSAGVAQWEREAHDLAIGHYLISLELSQSAGDIDGAARAAGNLGNLYNTLGDFDQARRYHQRALTGFEAVGNRIGQAGTLINLAALDFRAAEPLSRDGDDEQAHRFYASALDYGRQALAIFEELENPLGISYAANNVASALDYLGEHEASLVYHRRALEIRQQVGDRLGTARSLNTMAGALIRLGQLDEAAEALNESGELIPEDNLAMSEERSHRMVDLEEARGDYAAALAWQRELTRLRQRVSENQMGLRVEEMRLGFEAEQREQQLELLRNEAIIRELQLDRQRFASALALTLALGLLILLVLMIRLWRQGRRMAKALERVARRDPLTGLANRREMDARLADFAATGREQPSRKAGLLLIDADDFKRINDQLGHQRGDEVLIRLASVLTESLGKRGRIARWGGEEFLVLAPDYDRMAATALAEELRHAVAAANIEVEGQTVTITVGVSLMRAVENPDLALSRADRALYQGKADGKNRVVFEP